MTKSISKSPGVPLLTAALNPDSPRGLLTRMVVDSPRICALAGREGR